MLVGLIVVVGISLLAMAGSGAETGKTVVVRSLKDESLTLDLDRPRTLEVQGLIGTTTISIEDGAVRFTESPCPHKLCIERGPV